MYQNWGAAYYTGNTAVGYQALKGSATPANNTGTLNTSIGAYSLQLNSTGQKNNTLGAEALMVNTSGSDNVAIGSRSLFKNVLGGVNIAIGSNALLENMNGHSSIGIGGGALKNLILQGVTYNSALGEGGLIELVSGHSNDAQGVYTLSQLKTGSANIAMGRDAGLGIVNGSNNVFLGSYSKASSDMSNAIAIGSGAIVTQSNAIQLGNTSITNVKTSGIISVNGLSINGDPKPSAVVDLSNSKKGFLPPRLLASERDAIVSPEQGLMIYCMNCGQKGQAQLFDGMNWADFLGNTGAMALETGANYQGGKIAYIYTPSDPGYDAKVVHGIICSTVDQTANATSGYYPGETGCMWQPLWVTTDYFETTNATGTAIGEGKLNTDKIKAVQTSTGRSFAAANYTLTYNGGGYTDWVLPSREELKKIYLNKSKIGVFANGWYWTSTEKNNAYAEAIHFGTGSLIDQYKGPSGDPVKVRAIRYF